MMVIVDDEKGHNITFGLITIFTVAPNIHWLWVLQLRFEKKKNPKIKTTERNWWHILPAFD